MSKYDESNGRFVDDGAGIEILYHPNKETEKKIRDNVKENQSNPEKKDD